MSKYIEYSALLDKLDYDHDLEQWCIYDDDLAKLPAVDVAPVIHGYWIFKNGRCGCNVCRLRLDYDGNGVTLDLSHLPYCPHCGAKMDGDTYEQN